MAKLAHDRIRKRPGSASAPTMAFIATAAFMASAPAAAHHTYAMFDGSRTAVVTGTVAKLEWANPHVFIWLYVRNAQTGKHDLYAFENGSINVLARMGWSKTTFSAGEKISVEYWPLKDGRTGGHFLQATHADGRVTRGAGGPDANKALPSFDGAGR